MELVSEGDDIQHGAGRQVTLEEVGTQLLQARNRVLVSQEEEGFHSVRVHGNSPTVHELQEEFKSVHTFG